MKITKEQGRQFLLAHQKLYPPRELLGKEGIYDYIKKVGCIQYDPLDAVGYNPYLVLQSRIKGFQPGDLEELLYSDRTLLDGWDKNMSIYLIKDWPYFHRYREADYKRYSDTSKGIHKFLPKVRQAVKKQGPLSSKDLNFHEVVDWAWAPTRAARAVLESMYYWGELIIHHKVGTRKVYDFTHRHLPTELLEAEDPNKTLEGFFEWYVKRRIDGIGLLWNRSGGAWLGIRWMKSKERNEAISRLIEKGEITQIEIADISYPFFIGKEDGPLLEKILNGMEVEPKASFIAPLDNLMWDRKLIQVLFGYEYIWEVYKPAAERKYGYYVLPVLYGDKFVARFEPKFDKKTKKLDILNWWWEPDVEITEGLMKALRICLKEFLDYLGGEGVEIASDVTSIRKLKST